MLAKAESSGEYVLVKKSVLEELIHNIEEMQTPYRNAAEFIEEQIDKAIEQYEEYLKEKEE